MENQPSRLSNLKDLLNLMGSAVQAQKEIADILTEQHNRLYALEEDNKRLQGAIRFLEEKSRNQDKRYSEVLYKLADK